VNTRPALLAVTAMLFLASCERQDDRAGHLLLMAGEEAANIPNSLDRFTRQLNIADTQLQTNRKADAIKTLTLARDTLTAAKGDDFDDFHRIAGWTSISQLARNAGDRDLAIKSADSAQAALNDVKPVTERPQYVLSLATELADLRGKAATVELLDSGAAWAAEIPQSSLRRAALMAFTTALLNNDAYEDARNALHRDPDPAWRTDMVLALATQYETPAKPSDYASREQHRQYAATPVTAPRAVAEPEGSYITEGSGGGFGSGGAGGGGGFLNKDVRFENVYKKN